jgi:signal transduction histidine kinase/CheY-like chemotaxis protein
MRQWFESLPIRRKLTVLALGVSAVALVAAVSGLAIFDLMRFRSSAVDDAHAVAQLMAENLAAAIVFDDAAAARATLSTVRVRPTVVAACVYRNDTTLLAEFLRDPRGQCPRDPRDDWTWMSVTSTASVQQSGRVVGTVLVRRDLSDLGARGLATAAAGVLVLVMSGAIALSLARWLQRLVSRPITALAQAARSVGHDDRYELPPIPAPPDEVGELVLAFRDMVHRVGETNAALSETNRTLRTEVEQRRRMQIERDALLARERDASRLKDEFLAAVSHELRTPLNAILGWTQILQSGRPSEDTLARAIASIARNAQAQNRVIEDLLDTSRIITGKLQLSIKSVDLRTVIESALEVVEPVATARNITIGTELMPGPCVIQADYDRLRQVLWNLLSNAIKFTPSGGRVDVRLRQTADTCIIAVADTGSGIAPGFLPHVFERFRQADGSSTRTQGGLGIGLAIVKELVELHGGSVWAESEGQGRGATFTIRLPRALPAPTPRADPSASRTDYPRLEHVRVMVVDDNPDAVDIIAVALEQAGATVRTESDGASVVAAWERDPADVLLCDLAMPQMDGFEVLRQIRDIDARAGRATLALAVTAYASEHDRARCIRAGFAAHLAKPYRIADVLHAVAASLATHRNGSDGFTAGSAHS